jgi:hypothetical protein
MTTAKTDKRRRQWADQYGSRWYLYRDGTPPRDDDQDYRWTGFRWELIDYDDEES